MDGASEGRGFSLLFTFCARSTHSQAVGSAGESGSLKRQRADTEHLTMHFFRCLKFPHWHQLFSGNESVV
jgi:hypothetical protein